MNTNGGPSPPSLTVHGHLHGEAFCLMAYRCVGRLHAEGRKQHGLKGVACGHYEIFWNSRDGVTPFGTSCPSCGGCLQHTNFSADVYAPDHKPHRGQGIWRDGTPDDAERFMRERLEQCKGTKYECSPERANELVAIARSGDPLECSEFQKGWPMLERFGESV